MMSTKRALWTSADSFIQKFHHRWIASSERAVRKSPTSTLDDLSLSAQERELSARLMRVNHAGEVCAQALYLGHAHGCEQPEVQQHMLKAADEEYDHLVWCQQRLEELNSHSSYLSPFWFAGAYVIGFSAAKFGDAWGLGFVAETERQVEAHLSKHLGRLPVGDHTSRAVLEQMRLDEITHGEEAMARGGRELPTWVSGMMRQSAKIMTKLAYWI